MARKKFKVSVILPTYDEAGNIVELVEEIRHHLQMKRMVGEVIVVDDNSPDKTGLLARKYFAKNPDVRVIIRRKERGLATAIRKGIEMAVGEVIVVMDTDFNHEPKLVPRLVEKCKRYDVAVGSRYIKGGGMANKKREILSKLYNKFLIKTIIGSPVNDNLCGFFAMKHEELAKLPFDQIFYGYGDYFIRLIYFAHKQGNTFTEIPSFYIDRTYGASKSKFLKMFRDYAMSAVRVRLERDND
jgi:dolichol-phosphate mannosyltransferase